jgi:hypothetical protein
MSNSEEMNDFEDMADSRVNVRPSTAKAAIRERPHAKFDADSLAQESEKRSDE